VTFETIERTHAISLTVFLLMGLSGHLPVFFFAGRHDYETPGDLAEQYFEILEAPAKGFTWFVNSAHNPQYDEVQSGDGQDRARSSGKVSGGGGWLP
jgi:hypothetical protein